VDNVKTLKQALYNTIHHHHSLSVEAIAEELNMSPSYLARAALPDTDMDEINGTGVRFPLKQLIPLIRTTGDFQSLDFIENTLDRVAIDIPESVASLKSLQNDAVRAAAEFGDLMTEISYSCDDNTITAEESERICKEGWEAITAIMRIIVSCEQK